MPNHQLRIRKAQERLRELNIDALLVSAPADLLYLIGYHFHPSERMTMLAISQKGSAAIVMPQFEAARLGQSQEFVEVHPWTEAQKPVRVLAQVLQGSRAPSSIAVSEQMWAGFLVGIFEEFPRAKFINAQQVLTPLRMIKDPDEIGALERAQQIADAVFERICHSTFAGRSEVSVRLELTALRHDMGLEDCYTGIVGSGPNHSASPHHQTGERLIQRGDAVVMDFGGTYQGYHADITRTIHVGAPSQKFLDVYAIVEAAHQAAFNAYRPGASCESVDRAARAVIEKAGYGKYFTHRLGHGIGLDGHEPPYLVEGNTTDLRENMTFSDEPGIYIPGEFGIRIEDIVVVTEKGGRRFNHSTHELQVLD